VPTPSSNVVRGVYAITGGLGGLGLRAAQMLVESGVSCIVLTSRSGTLSKLPVAMATNTTLSVVVCDVSNAADVIGLLRREVPLGVLHAAGVLRDKMLRFMNVSDAQAASAPKARAASLVQTAVVRTPLEAFSLFSSVASTFGNVGQGNYAAANAYLDALARARRCHGVLVTSLQLPAVSGAGMGATTFDKDQLDAIGAITLDEFVTCLFVALAPAHAMTERTLAPLAPALIAGTSAPSFVELSYAQGKCTAATPVASSAEGSSLFNLEPSQRRTHVEELVLRVVRELTGLSEVLISAESSFMDVGVDSLAATELASRLRVISGLVISPTAALAFPTPRQLASHIIDLATQSGPSESIIGHRTSIMSSVALGRASLPPRRLHRPILLILSSPRSGSSLLQLCLNAHQDLYAGQELYLLMFDTMGERSAALRGSDFEEGLLATIMELQGCALAEAEAFLTDLGDRCPTWRVYEILQEMCAPRLLVDKTPHNASHALHLKRTHEVFDSPRYIHLLRHPYATIESGLKLQRDVLGGLDSTWERVEQEWFNTNQLTNEFLLNIKPSEKLVMRRVHTAIRWLRFQTECYLRDPCV